jgi:site-specific DNA-cytosine methylase
MTSYYNEFNLEAAQHLRTLMLTGHLPRGDIDTRSITEVSPDDLLGYTQCHFFAGVGGWSIALRMAGWDDTRPVWTGSCPCQPYSSAGKKKRQSDERHLWPDLARLIRERHPPVIFGEQVDDAIAAGWTDDAFFDLEAEDYACAQAVLPALSVGARHPRERIYFVAHTVGVGLPRQGRCIQSVDPAPDAYREADWFIDAIQGNALPYVCRRHHRVSRRLAHGLNRCFGNAIDPTLAAAFILSADEALHERFGSDPRTG